MLMQLGVLGKCKVRFLQQAYEKVHLACAMRKIIKATIERKGIQRAHAENDNGEVNEFEVMGLAYAESKKFLSWYEECGELHGGSYCDECPASLTMLGQAPSIMLEPTSRTEASSGDTEVGI